MLSCRRFIILPFTVWSTVSSPVIDSCVEVRMKLHVFSRWTASWPGTTYWKRCLSPFLFIAPFAINQMSIYFGSVFSFYSDSLPVVSEVCPPYKGCVSMHLQMLLRCSSQLSAFPCTSRISLTTSTCEHGGLDWNFTVYMIWGEWTFLQYWCIFSTVII